MKLFKVGSTPRLILVSLLRGNVMNSRGLLEIGWKGNEPVITSFVFVGLRSIRKHFYLFKQLKLLKTISFLHFILNTIPPVPSQNFKVDHFDGNMQVKKYICSSV